MPRSDLARFPNVSSGVLVVGAGPAGSTAAAALAGFGIPVWIVDQTDFPRPKICGDGIGPLALECLQETGFDLSGLLSRYPKIEHVSLVSPGGSRWRARYQKAPEDPRALDYGHVIPRLEFDEFLLRHAVSKGAHFEAGWSFSSLRREREWTGEVTLAREGETIKVRPRFVLAADGEHSAIRHALTGTRREASWLAVRGYVEGLRNVPRDIEFHFMKNLSPGYGWIFPEGDLMQGRANVGVYVRQERIGRGESIKEMLGAFLGAQGGAGLPLEGARLCSPAQGYPICPFHAGRRVLFGNTLLLGDAAGVADPLTGEGIFPSMYSGLCAAWAAREAFAAGPEGALSSYPGALTRMLLPLARRGSFLLALLSGLPSFVDWVFSRSARDEQLSEGIFRVVGGSGTLTALFSPTLWARLYFPWAFRSKALRAPAAPGSPPRSP